MSPILSYLLIPLVLLMLIINVVFRVAIIKRYKVLRNAEVDMDTKFMTSEKELRARYSDRPEILDEVLAFSRALKRLIITGIVGLTAIVIIFLIIYFSR